MDDKSVTRSTLVADLMAVGGEQLSGSSVMVHTRDVYIGWVVGGARELDSSLGAFPYDNIDLNVDAFEAITRAALDAGIRRSGTVGHANCHVLSAPALLDHARSWMEARFA